MRLMPASTMSEADPTLLAPTVVRWYSTAARDLPWRRPDAGPWAVLVSEVMLQQTPVRRVLPTYTRWRARWPTPADLAAASAGEAVREWGGLGYPTPRPAPARGGAQHWPPPGQSGRSASALRPAWSPTVCSWSAPTAATGCPDRLRTSGRNAPRGGPNLEVAPRTSA
jgi:hypothetical protein